MKKIITFSAICILASLILTSCKSGFSITKRHYNKGYYISRGHKSEKVSATVKKQDEPKVVKTEELVSVPNTNVDLSFADFYGVPVIANEVNSVKSKKINNKANSFKRLRPLRVNSLDNENISLGENLSGQKSGFTFSKSTGNASRGSDDGLSLLWIVIVVILILWLLGFLAGGFGLGGLINLLLLVALILLILWLLRVI